MKYPQYIVLTLSVAMSMLGVSCKKGSMPTLASAKIATVTKINPGGGRFYYHINYDSYNNVDSISILGGGNDTGYFDYLTFSYVGSSFIINDFQNGALMVDANTNGQIIKVLSTDTLIMTYNGIELTQLNYKLASTSAPYYTLDSDVYTWNNGDMTEYKHDMGVTDSCHYDMTRSGQVGDALSIENFLRYGRSYFSTVHLPDELSYNGVWIEEEVYTFDNDGRISMLQRVTNGSTNGASSPNDTTTYAYTYY